MLKDLIALPFLGVSWALANKRKWESYEELSLVSGKAGSMRSQATKMVEFAKLTELKGKVPTEGSKAIK